MNLAFCLPAAAPANGPQSGKIYTTRSSWQATSLSGPSGGSSPGGPPLLADLLLTPPSMDSTLSAPSPPALLKRERSASGSKGSEGRENKEGAVSARLSPPPLLPAFRAASSIGNDTHALTRTGDATDQQPSLKQFMLPAKQKVRVSTWHQMQIMLSIPYLIVLIFHKFNICRANLTNFIHF